MLMVFCAIFALINLCVDTFPIEFRNDRTIDEAGNCSVALLVKFFPSARTLNVIYSDDRVLSVDFFKRLSSNLTFLFLNRIVDRQSTLDYTIISNKVCTLRKIFREGCCSLFSRYLIFTRLPRDELSELADYLWRSHFAYVAFLIIDDVSKVVRIYQHESNCQTCNRPEAELSLVGRLNFRFNAEDVKIRSFSEIICPSNVCKLRFIRVDHGATKEELYDFNENGTEVRADSYGGCVLKAFARFYNIKVTREQYVGGYNWYNTVKAMNEGFVDVSFGPTLPFSHLVTHLDKGSAYAFEEFIFIAALPKTVPSFSTLITPLGAEVWICFMVIVLLYCFFVALWRRFHKKQAPNESLDYLHLVAMYFNQYINLPKNPGLRFIVITWLFYALLMNAIYNCNFISSIVKLTPVNMIQTFEELRTSGRKFGGPDVAREWLHDSEDVIMMDLYNRYEVINPDNISYALRKLKMVVAQTDYVVMKTGMPDFYVLNEKIVSYPLLYYIPKDHPYAMYIFRFMEKLRAGNIPLLDCPTKPKDTQGIKFDAVKLTHLRIVFEMLIIFYAISGILLFLERYTYKRLT